MKPTLLGKLVQISQAIEPFYNEYLKMMLSTFVVRAILFSESSHVKGEEEKMRLNRLREDVIKKGK